VAGATLLAAGSWIAASADQVSLFVVFLPLLIGWMVSVWLTDKYTHKYPQRYFTYLIASHGKAAVVMGLTIALFASIGAFARGISSTCRGALLFVLADLLLSLPRVRMSDPPDSGHSRGDSPAPSHSHAGPPPVHTIGICQQLSEAPDVARVDGLLPFIAECMQASDSGAANTCVIEGDSAASEEASTVVACLIQMKSLNNVKRLNLFLQELPKSVHMGGYFICRYRPMDEELERLRAEKSGAALFASYGWHFFRYRALPKIRTLERIYFSRVFSGVDSWIYRRTQRARRVISRAEMWGRMYYWGFEVLGERKIHEDHWVVTRRFRDPQTGRRPSFFLLARLSKVGLDGKPMHVRKVRSMYPFSEFIQERIYKEHGLSNTGKFKNDFRLTDYGKFVRRYWLDEIPQIFDWMRGEIKLVGMRATSPHFLSLYSQELYDVYVQTKPGLIPPIFDPNTNGFEDIARIELEYLRAYQDRPVTTDIRYFFRTLHDIFLRGIRSR
jgi:lipopolysaccharide/colanic/teichoic acid biosynthesis glycosyltransferase